MMTRSRFKLRLSLRQLFIGITVLTVLGALPLHRIGIRQIEMRIIARLRQVEIAGFYGDPDLLDRLLGTYPIAGLIYEGNGKALLTSDDVTGIEKLRNIASIDFTGIRAEPAVYRRLRELQLLERLDLSGAFVDKSVLHELCMMQQLKMLRLNGGLLSHEQKMSLRECLGNAIVVFGDEL